MSANTEWAAIVRKLESELAEARCTDPDHHAINAERSEARGLRKAWIKLDDQRQTLERELAEVTKQRDELANACKQLMEVVASPDVAYDDCWATEDEINDAWHAGNNALKHLTNKQP